MYMFSSTFIDMFVYCLAYVFIYLSSTFIVMFACCNISLLHDRLLFVLLDICLSDSCPAPVFIVFEVRRAVTLCVYVYIRPCLIVGSHLRTHNRPRLTST